MAWLLAPLILVHSVFYGFVLEIRPSEGAKIRIESHSEFEACDPGKHVFAEDHGDSVRELDLSALDEFPPLASQALLPAAPGLWADLSRLPAQGGSFASELRIDRFGSPPSAPLLVRLASVVIRV